jgi:hypothetical protein
MWESISGRCNDFSVHYCIQTNTEAYPASHPMNIRNPFLTDKAVAV